MKAFKEKNKMNREQAEKIITEYLKPIYGFALKRCANLQDAEDLTQEIIFRAFRTLLVRDDLDSFEKFTSICRK
jgi:DNA-directed RNA polymerase specialized sigma24 family protein